MKKTLLLLSWLPVLVYAHTGMGAKKHLHPYSHSTVTHLEEPSDLCLSTTDPSHFYIVSNRGRIAETDSNGNMLRRTKGYNGSDYEAICIKDNMLYALDESFRRVDMIDPSTFKLIKSFGVPFGGGRNKGMEGLVYNPDTKKFIAVVEKPAMIYELNENFQILSQTHYKQFTELSSVTYHAGFLWLLSDEDHEVMKVNATDYSIVDRWDIPVINPEGIVFNKEGDMMILSDDQATIYKFKLQ